MSGLFIQIESFVLTLILGIIAGIIFHFYQLSIRRAGIGKYPLYMLDLFLWIIMIAVVFLAMLLINQGEMRVYVLIAMLTGILLYFHTLAKRLQPLLSRIALLVVGVISALIQNMQQAFSRLKARVKAIIKKRKDIPPGTNGDGS